MTDTVNVLRPIVGIENRTAQEVFDIMSDRIRASLAAAPKADGMDAYTSDDMLNLISDEQARHLASSTDVSLVRARLKDILNAQLADKSRRLNPEAPKVEQEPVGHFIFTGSAWEEVHDAFAHHHDVTPLYTHPAPASDELLEALERADEAIGGADISKIRHGEGGVDLAKKVVDLKSASQNLVANHKGPQS